MINIDYKKIGIVLCVFVFLYAPPLIPSVSTIHILFVISCFYLFCVNKTFFCYIKKNTPYSAFYVKSVFIFIYLFVAMFFSYLMNPVNISNYIETLYKFFQALIELPICACFICSFFENRKYKYEDILSIIIYAAFIQVIIGFLMMISPNLKYEIVSFMQTNNGKSINDIPGWEYSRRYFAFSDCVLDMYGWGMGIISFLPVYLSINHKKRLAFMFIAPLLLLNGVMNSISTVIIFGTMLVVYAFINIKKIPYRYAIIIMLIPFLLVLFLVILGIASSDTFEWLGREALSVVGKTDKKTSMQNLFSEEFWSLPSSLGAILFGTGHTLYGAEGYAHSDVGYINLIWLCGVIGTIFIVYTFCEFIVAKTFLKKEKALLFSIAATFCVFLIKGNGVGNNPGLASVFLIVLGLGISTDTI